MKPIIVFSLAALFVLSGCTISKRHHLRGYHIEWRKKIPREASAEFAHKDLSHPEIAKKPAGETKPGEVQQEKTSEQLPELFADGGNLLAAPVRTNNCDMLILRNGDEIPVKVLEVTPDLVKYRKCDFPDGPLYSIRKTEIFLIKYANGSREVIETRAADPVRQADYDRRNRKLDAGALMSFLFAFGAFLPIPVVGILLLIASLIMGILAIIRINNNPNKLKGKGFAIAGIIISGIMLLFIVLFLIAFL